MARLALTLAWWQIQFAGAPEMGVGVDLGGSVIADLGSSAAEDAPASGELTPAVVGEAMAATVIPYAEEHGYVYYAAVDNPEDYTSEELLAHNRTDRGLESRGQAGHRYRARTWTCVLSDGHEPELRNGAEHTETVRGLQHRRPSR
jgi:hypothetical protein